MVAGLPSVLSHVRLLALREGQSSPLCSLVYTHRLPVSASDIVWLHVSQRGGSRVQKLILYNARFPCESFTKLGTMRLYELYV